MSFIVFPLRNFWVFVFCKACFWISSCVESRAIVIFQAEEGVAMGMWNDPEAKVMIESSGHIYDETTITQWIDH